jgi:DNA-directed RNA polymerase alpha subunit
MKVANYFNVYPSYLYVNFDNATDQSMNELRKILYNKLENYAFDALVVKKNISFTRDEVMMDYFNFVLLEVPKDPKPIKTSFGTYYGVFRLTVKGNGIVMSNDIDQTENSNGFKVIPDQPLFWLRENEEVDLLIYIGKGRGADHVKFRHVTEAGRVIKEDPFYSSYLRDYLSLEPGSPKYLAEIDKVTDTTMRFEVVNPYGPSAIELVKFALQKVVV